MPHVNERKDAVALSYFASRRAVGWIALLLPFALAIPVAIRLHVLESSISGYYYTGARTLFVGSLCAISMFMLSARGYDCRDEIAGMLSALFALGVAFFPTAPDGCEELRKTSSACASCFKELQQSCGSGVHYTFAALLFSTLAFFCLVLFKMTRPDGEMTPQKKQRNVVYTVCGWVIVASMALIFTASKILHIQYLVWEGLQPTLLFESTALIAFGTAWLVKGEFVLKDANDAASK